MLEDLLLTLVVIIIADHKRLEYMLVFRPQFRSLLLNSLIVIPYAFLNDFAK